MLSTGIDQTIDTLFFRRISRIRFDESNNIYTSQAEYLPSVYRQ